MSRSLFVRQSLATRANLSAGSIRLASSSSSSSSSPSSRSPLNTGPSSVETKPQAGSERGKTTQAVLPITAGLLALGAFAWFFTSNDKRAIVPVGVNQEGNPDKLKSGSVARAQEQIQKSNESTMSPK